MQFTPLQFYTREDIVVVGQDFEAADWDNPNGYLYGMQQYVMVSNEHGDTFELGTDFGNQQRNQRQRRNKWLPMAPCLKGQIVPFILQVCLISTWSMCRVNTIEEHVVLVE